MTILYVGSNILNYPSISAAMIDSTVGDTITLEGNYSNELALVTQNNLRAIRFSENVVADIREWTSTWGRRALDFGGRAGYHDFNQI